MTAADPTPASHPCRACARPVPDGAARCPACSAAQGPFEPCPHCRAEAGVSPHRELRFCCDVCGGPRIPRGHPALRLSGREVAPLRRAESSRKARAGWGGAAIAAGLLLPVTLAAFGLLLLLLGAKLGLLIAAGAVTAPLVAFLVMAASRARSKGAAIGPAIDEAWLSVARDLAQEGGDVSPPALARRLGIDEAQAEELTALLDVDELTGGPPRPAPRVRIAPVSRVPDPGLGAGPTELAAAEEEAVIAEQVIAPTVRRPGSGEA